jgi:hypothetical protein
MEEIFKKNLSKFAKVLRMFGIIPNLHALF